MLPSRYSDETSTGRVFGRPRSGRPKVTIAARAESSDGFEWFTTWKHDYCPAMGEVKSEAILRIAETNRTAAARLQQGLSTCPIFVVDLRENTHAMLERIRPWLPARVPDDMDVFEIANNPKTLSDVALGLLVSARQMQIGASAFGAIEAMMSDDTGYGAEIRSAGLDDYFQSTDRKFDQRRLLELSDQDFEVLVGRFAVALGDALSPEAQVRAITEQLGSSMFLGTGHIASRALGEALASNYVYDAARSRHITEALVSAHGEVVDFVEQQRARYLRQTLTPGTLREDDSRNVLGIQVADIAAGVAADLYERSRLRSVEAARVLTTRFDRVFLNRRWL